MTQPQPKAAPSRWYSRTRVHTFIHSSPVQYFVIAVILLNAAVLGIETSTAAMDRWGSVLHTIDLACLTIFIVEIGLKLYALGHRFFKDTWNVFDFVVVAIALVPGAGPFAVLRSLRVLRVLRLISMVPALRRVVSALLKAVPGIASIGALLLIVFYVGAVMATGLFGGHFPAEYGTIGRSLFSLFQVMTLDNWSTMVREIWSELPWAPAFFIPFVIVSAMAVLNLLVAVIVDAMQGLDRQESASIVVPPENTAPARHGEDGADSTSIRPACDHHRARNTQQKTGDGLADHPRVAEELEATEEREVAQQQRVAEELAQLRAQITHLTELIGRQQGRS